MTEQEKRARFFKKTGRLATTATVEYQAFLWGIEFGVEAEREACAALCGEVGQQPSSLWHEHGCWTHAAQVCAESIALRSNAPGNRHAAPDKD